MAKHYSKSLILYFFLLTPAFLFCQALNGSYTIGGTNPDYQTFNGAVEALDSLGVSGPVIFNVRDGNYVEKLLLQKVSGASDTNAITFQSASGDSSLVNLEWYYDGGDPHVKLNSAEHFRFYQITFLDTGYIGQFISSPTYVKDFKVWHCAFVDSNNAYPDFDGIYFKCDSAERISIEGNYFQNSMLSIESDSSKIYQVSISDNYFENTTSYSYINLKNVVGVNCTHNRYLRYYYGLYAAYCKNVTFSNNAIDLAWRGVHLYHTGGKINIENNVIQNNSSIGIYIQQSDTASLKVSQNTLIHAGGKAIDVEGMHGPLYITENYITEQGGDDGILVYNITTDSLGAFITKNTVYTHSNQGINLSQVDGTFGGSLIANNMIAGCRRGIFIENCDYVKSIFNSVSGLGNTINLLYAHQNKHFTFYNNILKYTANGIYPLGFMNLAGNSDLVMNYNNYYFDTINTSISLTGTDSTLQAWQNSSGMDTNSIFTDPLFYNDTNDLRICNGQLYHVGILQTIVSDDIFGTYRNPSAPSIGAYELQSGSPGPTANFSYTIDSLGNNYFDVHFMNTTSGGYAYYWDFGDGDTSTQTNPSHGYTSNGPFTVMLIAYSPCSVDTLYKTIFDESLKEEAMSNFRLYPNPTKNDLVIEWLKPLKEGRICILNSIGQLERQYDLPQDQSINQFTIDLGDLPIGFYLVQLKSENQVETQKVFKE